MGVKRGLNGIAPLAAYVLGTKALANMSIGDIFQANIEPDKINPMH